MASVRVMYRLFTLPHCEACGEVRVIHSLERLLSWIEEHTTHRSVRIVQRHKKSAERRLKFWKFLSTHGLCTLHSSSHHTQDSRVHALFEGAAAARLRLYDLTVFGLHQCFFIVDAVGRTLMFYSLPHELLAYSSPIAIDDKFALAQHLKHNKIPMPQTWCVRGNTVSSDVSIPTEKFPLITKPCIGTRGRHTTLHHTNATSLKSGIRLARQISTRVVIQEEIPGTVYRFTVLGCKRVFAAKREYPHIVGDGISTIKQLIERENKSPLRDGVYFRQIPFGDHEVNYLLSKGLSQDSIVKAGETCLVSDKNSRRNGTVIDDVTSQVDATIIEYTLSAAKLLNSPIVGFDVILTDHTKTMNDQTVRIIECNSVPYIDVHHRVASGEPHNVAAELYNLVIDAYNLQRLP